MNYNRNYESPKQRQVESMRQILSLVGKELTDQQKRECLRETKATNIINGYKKMDEFKRINRNQHILDSARKIYGNS